MVVLITGASGGLGRVLGATLASRGMTVYGTARDPARDAEPCPFPMLAMEVTDPASVGKCVNEVLEREGRIDVVIVQPVAMKMDRPATGPHLATVKNVAPDSPSHRMVERMARDTAASRLTPEAVAERIHQVITSESKPLRVPLDRARLVTLVKRLAPQSVIDRLVGGLVRG